MGIDLSSLVQTGLGALSTARKQRKERAEEEEARALRASAERRAMQQSLLSERLGESLIRQRAQTPVRVDPYGPAATTEVIRRQGAAARARQAGKPPSGLENKVRLGAHNAADALTRAETLLAQDPEADVEPEAAAAMEGLSRIPVVGGMATGMVEAQRQRRRSPSQQAFQSYMDQFVHNAVGLLPGSRQSIVLFQNLRQAYVPAAGQSPEARAAKRAQRNRLIALLKQLAAGERVDFGDLPGFVEAAPQTGAPSYNPKFWTSRP